MIELGNKNCLYMDCSYVAPEYAENGMVSVRTDVYAYGITLIQIISGRKAVTSDTQDHHQSLRQWVFMSFSVSDCHFSLLLFLLFFTIFFT